MTRCRQMCFSVALVLVSATSLGAQRVAHDPDSARIVTEDIARFWNAFDHRADAGTAAALDRWYLSPGTAGLRDWTRLRLKDAETLGAVVDAAAGYYASARASTLSVAGAEPQIRAAFRKLKALYPEAVFPDVYFLIGRLSSGGTTSDAGLLIGTEMYGRTSEAALAGLDDWLHQVLRPVDELPGIVAHELVHYQQVRGGNSLLAQALREGGADFVGEMISGMNINSHVHAWVHASPDREPALWDEFQRQMRGTDGTGWFSSSNVNERPKDLGYFMGYRISQAYYDHAADKQGALREILTLRDPEVFLRKSGYAGKP